MHTYIHTYIYIYIYVDRYRYWMYIHMLSYHITYVQICVIYIYMYTVIIFARFAECHHQRNWSQVSSPFWVSCASCLAMIHVQLFYVSSLSSRWFLCWIPMELPGAHRAPGADLTMFLMLKVVFFAQMLSYMGLIHFRSWLAKYVHAAYIQKHLAKGRMAILLNIS